MSAPQTLKMAGLAAAVAGTALLGWWSEQPRRGRGSERTARPAQPERAIGAPRPLDGAPKPLDSAPLPPITPAARPTAEVATSAASAAKSASAASSASPPSAQRGALTTVSAGLRTILRRADVDMASGPLYFTGAFDGSRRFGMWAETMRFAREAERRYGKAIHFTYFINTCYYDTTTEGSIIGKAQSAAEVRVRRALTQQAINEGHEIASHTVRHRDGSLWSADEWRRELREFHETADAALFQPIRDEDGEPVFPRFRAAPSAAAGSTGAACRGASDCASGHCLAVTADRSFCTEECNQAKPCPAGTACGTPDYSDDTDVCVPVPEYPIEHLGGELFDAEGRPNRSRPELIPYRAVGFRAPFLGYSDALLTALLELGYTYDASLVLDPGPPLRASLRGEAERSIFELGLTQQPGARTFPMDFNYLAAGADGDRMKADYRRSLVFAYGPGRRSPWNVGHHFALWRGGEYWRAMQDAFSFAAEGCPSDRGERRCPDVEFPSFRELAELMTAEERRRAASSPAARKDGPAIRPKARPSRPESDSDSDSAEPH